MFRIVIAGLDPAIQSEVQTARTLRWLRGPSPRMAIHHAANLLLARMGPVRRRGDTLRNVGLPSERIRRPDTRPTGLAGECADQSRLIRGAETPESRAEDEDWFDASDRTGWTAWQSAMMLS
jgi:hypothetical protein